LEELLYGIPLFLDACLLWNDIGDFIVVQETVKLFVSVSSVFDRPFFLGVRRGFREVTVSHKSFDHHRIYRGV
jgi:hypothetical protein